MKLFHYNDAIHSTTKITPYALINMKSETGDHARISKYKYFRKQPCSQLDCEVKVTLP